MEQEHPDDAAQQAADAALHGLFRAHVGGQLVLSAGHAREEGEGIAAEGDGQGQPHHHRPVVSHPEPQQAGENQRENDPAEDARRQVGKGHRTFLPVAEDGVEEEPQHKGQSQNGKAPGKTRRLDLSLQGEGHDAVKGFPKDRQRYQCRAPLRQNTERPIPRRTHGVEEFVGPHSAEGHHQQHGGPGRGEAQHQHQQGNADDPHHHSFEHCLSPFPASCGTPSLSHFFTPPKRRSRC